MLDAVVFGQSFVYDCFALIGHTSAFNMLVKIIANMLSKNGLFVGIQWHQLTLFSIVRPNNSGTGAPQHRRKDERLKLLRSG